jgi:metallophosphoesterase superfamily enzyme
VPCFIASDEALVVPAFSDWAAGCDIQRRSFLGPIARRARFHTAYACLGPRLLEIPLHSSTHPNPP